MSVTARPSSWREEARQDKLVRAQIERDREAARLQARIAEREAAARVKLAAAGARRDAKAAASAAHAARLAALAGWCAANVVELLFVPVIGVPALLSWTAMAAFGARLYPAVGYLLPAFSEGTMWAFAAAVTLTLHRHPGRPVWHLRAGIAVFAAFGAGLNYVHGLTVPPFPGMPPGPVIGGVMAAISVAGVTAHQLITAGPTARRRNRDGDPAPADAAAAAPEPAPEVTPATGPEPHPVPVPGVHPARTRTRAPGAPARRTRTAPGCRTPVTTESAEARFAADLAAGTVPSVRQIKAELHVGQDRARDLRDHLTAVADARRPADGETGRNES
jgi:hypothetical protein